MNACRRIAEYVGEQLNIGSAIFDPLDQQISCQYDGDAVFACMSERIAFAPALGMALSDNMYTPNFLFTYKDKEREASVKKINLMVFFAFICSVSLCAGVFFYQLYAVGEKTKTLQRLERELGQYNPPIDQNLIMQTASVLEKDLASAKAYSQKYRGMAIISDLSVLTPPNIRLINFKAKLGGLPDKSKEATNAKPPASAQAKLNKEETEVEMEGFVFGDRESLETMLMAYIMKLDNSPMFHQISVQKKNEETFRKTTALHFIINMKVG
jgi:hypothetical protein